MFSFKLLNKRSTGREKLIQATNIIPFKDKIRQKHKL